MNSTTRKVAGASLLALTVTGLGFTSAAAANANTIPQPPGNDAYIGSQDTTLTVDAANGVFANDDCAGGVPTIGSIENFINGELNIHVDGSFEYTPAAGFIGQRTFDYQLLCDGVPTGFATAAIVFGPTVPVGAADFYSTPQDTTLTVAASGVLANDTGAQAVVEAKDLPDGLTAQLDGSFVYVPPTGFVGDVSWSYRMSDGTDTFSDWILVTISVTPVTPAIVPTVDEDGQLPTLAYTGGSDVTTWLLGPAIAFLGLGAAAALVARRRARLSE